MPIFSAQSPTTGSLINIATAILNPQLAALNATNPSGLLFLLQSASQACEAFCKRQFALTAYTSYFNGANFSVREPLRLREFPVQSISRVACNPTQAIQVQNSANTAQRATVATSSNGITLWAIESGVVYQQEFLYTDYPIIQDVVNAMNSAGAAHGFQCTIQTAAWINLALYPTADLFIIQGATSCIGGGCYLSAWLEDIQVWNFTGNNYWQNGQDDYTNGGFGWRLQADTGLLYASLPRGNMNIRIDYIAGFDPIPWDVQNAVTLMAVYLLNVGNQNPTQASERLGDYSETNRLVPMPPAVKQLLARYRCPDKIMGYQ